MLKDRTLVEKFYNHPLVLELPQKIKMANLAKIKGQIKRPEYIPNPIFATAALKSS